jgi:beta-phosphoglucomutase
VLEAIVFDFDGVLVDSEPLHFRSFRDTLAAERIDLPEHDYYTRYLGLSDRAAFELIGAEYLRPWVADQVAALMARKAVRFEQLERTSVLSAPGADVLVKEAADAVPIAVASGARREEVVRILDRIGLRRYFTAIVAAEDVAASKPAPDAYLEALRRLSTAARTITPSRSVAIEDSVRGLESARAAGLKTVAVSRPYNGSEPMGADLVIASLATLNLTHLQKIVSR